ncbi:uncharacterized protein LOC143582956 [Bidens hawaiensis]|uniref:uncharacterized protein LOC143582956 n=1 Tax=Bidens hawaiensis TaxID=980011 RepID=UPI0040492B2A
MLQKVSNLIKLSIFIAKMRLIHLKRYSTKFINFKPLRRYNSYYGILQERQFSPSSTPLISFCRRKSNGSEYYSICFLSCFGHGDEGYSIESANNNIVEVDRDCLEVSYSSYGVEEEEEEEEEDDDSVDEKAERFIERFYEEMKRQRRESLSSSSSTSLPFNRMLQY